jgi:hypothetical protein
MSLFSWSPQEQIIYLIRGSTARATMKYNMWSYRMSNPRGRKIQPNKMLEDYSQHLYLDSHKNYVAVFAQLLEN